MLLSPCRKLSLWRIAKLSTGISSLVLFAGTGSAEVELGYHDALETRFGTFSTIDITRALEI